MTDHQPARPVPIGEETNPNSIREIAKNSPRASYQEIAAVDERDVDAALGAYVPGGASALCWLPMKDGHTIEPVARDVMRSAIAAVDKRRSLATEAAQPADGYVRPTSDDVEQAIDTLALWREEDRFDGEDFPTDAVDVLICAARDGASPAQPSDGAGVPVGWALVPSKVIAGLPHLPVGISGGDQYDFGWINALDAARNHVGQHAVHPATPNAPPSTAGEVERLRQLIEDVQQCLTPPGSEWVGNEPAWQVEAWRRIEEEMNALASPSPVASGAGGEERAIIGGLLACIKERRTDDPAIAQARAYLATPQVPNDEVRAAAQALLDAVNLRALRGRDHVPSMRAEQDASRALRAALATERGA